MEKIEAYKCLAEIRGIIDDLGIFVKNNIDIPPDMMYRLTKLGDLTKNLYAYVLITNDNDLIKKVEQTPRYPLAVLIQYDLDKITRLSVSEGWRNLLRIAPQNLLTDVAETSAKEPQPLNYEKELGKDLETRVMKIYDFWKNCELNPNGYINVFYDVTPFQFCKMVSEADFLELYNTKSFKHRVGQSVVVLSKIIKDENWTLKAEKNLGTTIINLQKNTNFAEYEDLKDAFPQFCRRMP